MKNYILGLMALILVAALPGTTQFASALPILTAPQGGTGIGSALIGDIGNCVKVANNSPFTYLLGTCGSGGGGANSKWATTTNNLDITTNGGGGIIISNGTTTNATSTYLFSTTIQGVNATTTGWLSSLNLNVTNATTTAFSSSISQLGAATSTSLFSPILQSTNATTSGWLNSLNLTVTNATTTALSSNASQLGNGTSSNFFSGVLQATNATATQSFFTVSNRNTNSTTTGTLTTNNYTGVNSTTTNETWTGHGIFYGKLTMPTSTDPSITAAGDIAINTFAASTSLRYHDGTSERSVNNIQCKGLTAASSTLAYIGAFGATGTTTLPVMNSMHPLSLVSAYCRTDTGTANANFIDGGARTNNVSCSTAPLPVTLNENTTFIQGQGLNVEIGRSASAPNLVTVTLCYRETAE